MAVNLPPLAALQPVPGVRLVTASGAIKKPGRDDMVLLVLDAGSVVAGVFTQSHFQAAPVLLAREGLGAGAVRGLLINSGNANAATGEPGLADARRLCAVVGDQLGGRVLPFSTGVIGERLPVDRMLAALDGCAARAVADGWAAAARAIMTTDTAPKALSRQCRIDDVPVTITGMAKGAGMIKPDMATMLGFVACDARISQPVLQALTRRVADASFNRITIDGDTSTNDAFIIVATGQAAHPPIESLADERVETLAAALTEVARELAQRIIRDGEGATKFVTVQVGGGRAAAECLAVAYTVAESPLVKTALFAGDPNWGRFCMAIGRSDVPDLDPAKVDLYLDEVCVARGGLMDPAYTEAAGAGVMARDEFTVRIDLGRGSAQETVWTSDLSYEYVRINAEYRT